MGGGDGETRSWRAGRVLVSWDRVWVMVLWLGRFGFDKTTLHHIETTVGVPDEYVYGVASRTRLPRFQSKVRAKLPPSSAAAVPSAARFSWRRRVVCTGGEMLTSIRGIHNDAVITIEYSYPAPMSDQHRAQRPTGSVKACHDSQI